MKFLITESWKGYCTRAGRVGQTEILSHSDSLANSSQVKDKLGAGSVTMESVTFTFEEDASVMAIMQKLIDLEVVDTLIIEDVSANAAQTVVYRLTMNKVVIISVSTNNHGVDGSICEVKVRCQKAKWERLTPDGAYAEAIFNPHALA
jgi:type VI protein secretion system component Hcp